MKDVIVALAKYNQGANLNVIETLGKAGAEIVTNETGTYYKSVLATLQHCLWLELAWLKRYKALGDYPSLRATVLEGDVDGLKAKVGDDFAKLSALMKEIDALYVSFIEEIRLDDLQEHIRYKNIHGQDQDKIVWQTIFHHLLHFTHHRGEVSGSLDRMGVDNDFSGFFKYL